MWELKKYSTCWRSEDDGTKAVFGARLVPTKTGCVLSDTHSCRNTNPPSTAMARAEGRASATAGDQPPPRGQGAGRRGTTNYANSKQSCRLGQVGDALLYVPTSGDNSSSWNECCARIPFQNQENCQNKVYGGELNRGFFLFVYLCRRFNIKWDLLEKASLPITSPAWLGPHKKLLMISQVFSILLINAEVRESLQVECWSCRTAIGKVICKPQFCSHRMHHKVTGSSAQHWVMLSIDGWDNRRGCWECVCKSSVASVQMHEVATGRKQHRTGWGLAKRGFVRSKMYDQSCLYFRWRYWFHLICKARSTGLQLLPTGINVLQNLCMSYA